MRSEERGSDNERKSAIPFKLSSWIDREVRPFLAWQVQTENFLFSFCQSRCLVKKKTYSSTNVEISALFSKIYVCVVLECVERGWEGRMLTRDFRAKLNSIVTVTIDDMSSIKIAKIKKYFCMMGKV